MSLPKDSLITKSIVSHKGSVAPYDTLHPDGCHVSTGRHISMGCQVPRGLQVPSLTPGDTFRLESRHVSMGR